MMYSNIIMGIRMQYVVSKWCVHPFFKGLDCPTKNIIVFAYLDRYPSKHENMTYEVNLLRAF